MEKTAATKTAERPATTVHRKLSARSHSAGTPLDSGFRSEMEPKFNHDFSKVRIHADESAHGMASSLGAQAFTHGSDIFFSRGAYGTSTHASRSLVAHELAHTVQSPSPGPIQAKLSVAGESSRAEVEADTAAALAVSGKAVPRGLLTRSSGNVVFCRRLGIPARVIDPGEELAGDVDRKLREDPRDQQGEVREALAPAAPAVQSEVIRKVQPENKVAAKEATGQPRESDAKAPPPVETATPTAALPDVTAQTKISDPDAKPPATGEGNTGKAELAESQKPVKPESGAVEAPVPSAAVQGAGTAKAGDAPPPNAASPTGPTAASAAPVSIDAPVPGESPAAEAMVTSTPSPQENPGFLAVQQQIAGTASSQKEHQPARSAATAAQNAAVSPPSELQSKAQERQVEGMAAQKPKGFDREKFKSDLIKKVADITPKNLGEVEKFKDSPKVGQLAGQLGGTVKAANQEAAGGIPQAAAAPPDKSGLAQRPSEPLKSEAAGSPPPAIKASDALPAPKPDEQVSLAAGPQEIESRLQQENIQPETVRTSNEPTFLKAAEAGDALKAHSETAPADFRTKEAQTLGEAGAQSDQKAGGVLSGMFGKRGNVLGAVANKQSSTKGADEAKRAEVAGNIQGIYDATKKAVSDQLDQVEKDALSTFDTGAKAATDQFVKGVADDMFQWKVRRYLSPGGIFLATKDLFCDLPPEVNEFYYKRKAMYEDTISRLVDNVASLVERGLTAATNRIAKGREDIKVYVETLPESVRQFGDGAAKDIGSKFDDLEQTVNEKRDSLIDALAQKYVESAKGIDDEINKMREANKGLLTSAKEAYDGVVKTLQEMRAMLAGALKNAAGTLDFILNHPIQFLENLALGLRTGFERFYDKIGEHLKKGLLDWLFGALTGAGLVLPEKFDLAGIFSIICQVLGLTYQNIRSRAVKIVGEKVVSALETGAEIFMVLMTKGLAGLWEMLKEQLESLKETVLDGIKGMVMETIISAGIKWVLSLLNPASALVKACLAIKDIVVFFFERGKQIVELVAAVVTSIGEIAAGNVASAAGFVERALAKSVPVLIGLLASVLNLGGISEKIAKVIKAIQAKVEPLIDWVINKAVSLVKRAGKALGFGKNDEKEGSPYPQHQMKVDAGLADIDVREKAVLTHGKISREEAEKIAIDVKVQHKVFKSITVVSGSGGTWDYQYVASRGKKVGEPKEELITPGSYEELIGKHIDKFASAPPGYAFYYRGDRKWIRRTDIDDKYPQLTVQDNGIVKQGNASSNRLSNPNQMTRNFGPPEANTERHHLIPDILVRTHALCKAARAVSPPYDVDRASNIIRLPINAEGAKKYPGLPLHRGGHAIWIVVVTRRLNSTQTEMEERTEQNIAKCKDAKLLESYLTKVEASLRREIKKRDKI